MALRTASDASSCKLPGPHSAAHDHATIPPAVSGAAREVLAKERDHARVERDTERSERDAAVNAQRMLVAGRNAVLADMEQLQRDVEAKRESMLGQAAQLMERQPGGASGVRAADSGRGRGVTSRVGER